MTTRPEIDPIAAAGLKRLGLTYREIGIHLAEQAGRTVAFKAESIARAIKPLTINSISPQKPHGNKRLT